MPAATSSDATASPATVPASADGSSGAHGSVVWAESVGFDYRRRRALEGVGFAVPPGSLFGFLGPNGSGKSTLFRLLATLLPPQAGRLVIAGHDVAREPRRVRESVGVAFQSPSLDLRLTVEENLRHHGHLHGLAGRELARRIDENLERFGVTGRRRERAEVLSGGLRRRVELAKALLHRPPVLLLDEPSTGLDPRARRDLWRVLEELVAGGVTVLLTTHFIEEAEGCHRLLLLDRGHVVAAGTPRELTGEVGGEVVTLTAGGRGGGPGGPVADGPRGSGAGDWSGHDDRGGAGPRDAAAEGDGGGPGADGRSGTAARGELAAGVEAALAELGVPAAVQVTSAGVRFELGRGPRFGGGNDDTSHGHESPGGQGLPGSRESHRRRPGAPAPGAAPAAGGHLAGWDVVARLARRLPRWEERVAAVTVARPTLEDVFLHRTGRHLDETPEERTAATAGALSGVGADPVSTRAAASREEGS